MRVPHIILALALAFVGAAGYYLYDTRGAEPDKTPAGATSTSALEAATITEASDNEQLDVPREVTPVDDVQSVPVEQEVTQPATSAPRATSTPTAAPKAQTATLTSQNAARSMSVATSALPYMNATVTGSFQIKVEEHAEVTVCNEAGWCLGITQFAFCTQDTPEARTQLQELCADECTTKEIEAEVREQFCQQPSYVREELPNSSYFKSSVHQLLFNYSPHPARVYHVRVVASESGPLWVGTYARDNDTDLELSSFVFEAQVGSTLTYDIVTGADGAIELRRAQLDYEGDGVVDKELSHRPRSE